MRDCVRMWREVHITVYKTLPISKEGKNTFRFPYSYFFKSHWTWNSIYQRQREISCHRWCRHKHTAHSTASTHRTIEWNGIPWQCEMFAIVEYLRRVKYLICQWKKRKHKNERFQVCLTGGDKWLSNAQIHKKVSTKYERFIEIFCAVLWKIFIDFLFLSFLYTIAAIIIQRSTSSNRTLLTLGFSTSILFVRCHFRLTFPLSQRRTPEKNLTGFPLILCNLHWNYCISSLIWLSWVEYNSREEILYFFSFSSFYMLENGNSKNSTTKIFFSPNVSMEDWRKTAHFITSCHVLSTRFENCYVGKQLTRKWISLILINEIYEPLFSFRWVSIFENDQLYINHRVGLRKGLLLKKFALQYLREIQLY